MRKWLAGWSSQATKKKENKIRRMSIHDGGRFLMQSKEERTIIIYPTVARASSRTKAPRSGRIGFSKQRIYLLLESADKRKDDGFNSGGSWMPWERILDDCFLSLSLSVWNHWTFYCKTRMLEELKHETFPTVTTNKERKCIVSTASLLEH